MQKEVDWAREEVEKAAEELKKKERGVQDRVNQEKDQANDSPLESVVPSGSTTIESQVSLIELELVPFIPSHAHVVANLDTIFFNQRKKRIVRR